MSLNTQSRHVLDCRFLQVHPKLNQMDQDKVARIYSDLRKESMVGVLDCSILWPHLPNLTV